MVRGSSGGTALQGQGLNAVVFLAVAEETLHDAVRWCARAGEITAGKKLPLAQALIALFRRRLGGDDSKNQ